MGGRGGERLQLHWLEEEPLERGRMILWGFRGTCCPLVANAKDSKRSFLFTVATASVF